MSLFLASVLASALTATPASVDPRLSILDAMKEELERNRTRLKLGENGPPYFISRPNSSRSGRHPDPVANCFR